MLRPIKIMKLQASKSGFTKSVCKCLVHPKLQFASNSFAGTTFVRDCVFEPNGGVEQLW